MRVKHQDMLQFEFDHGRLSTGALAAGRAIEDVLAAQHRSAGASWAERVDTSPCGDAQGVATADAARRVVVAMARVERIIGPIDARLVRRLLGEGETYESVAAVTGRSGARAISYIAQRFRDALEELAEASKAVGPLSAQNNDKYTAASDAIHAQNG